MTIPNDVSHLVTITLDNPTEIARSDVDGVVATLQNNDGEFISDMIGGENKIGTGPIRDAYLALVDTNMIGQFENVNGFIAKAQYPNERSTTQAEWGSIGNLRFFVTSRGSVTANASLLGADIYNMFIVAQESYCSIDLDGSSAQFIYHPAGLTNKNALVQYKSSLIDSKTLAGKAEDNEAQATERCAA
jgi:N4-gp56 family major capsid protein